MENNNIEFDSLSQSEKRLLIMRDTLSLIHAGSLKMETGNVVNVYQLKARGYDADLDLKSHLQKFFNDKRNECEVCQRGALFLSLVYRDNKFKTLDLANTMSSTAYGQFRCDVIDKRLLDVFDEQQIVMMETAFEGYHNKEYLGEELYLKCVYFADQLTKPSQRSIAILENAIAHGGIFTP